MSNKVSLIIFTDLDGSLLHRDNFKFDEIKDYVKNLIDNGIVIIPNTSKTEKEIEKFIKELGSKLPFISENGSSIHGLNLINPNFVFSGFLYLSYFKFTNIPSKKIFKIFEKKIQ